MGRPITPLPSPASTALPWRWPWKARATASQLTTSHQVLIETEMTHAIPAEVLKMIIGRVPAGHMGEPADIARGVVFLTSDDAKYITGSTISINGGMHVY